MKKYLISSKTKYKEDLTNLIGGKANSLLKFNDLNVPKWFVLTTEFFIDVYKEELSTINTHVLNEDFDALEKLIMLKKLDFKYKNLILKNIKDDGLYAVRSSAVDEDNKNASFAGMMSSYLNIGKDALLTYIKRTFLSAFNKRAIEYRKTMNLSLLDIKMAVIVQEMVEPDASGVLFTINPVTKNPDEFLISATPGLGEALVSGEVDSHDYYFNAGSIKGDSALLSKKDIENIALLGAKVLARSTTFQDIEFCIKNKKVYLLQARPIAPFSYINIHDEKCVYDNANIIESYSGTTTMLTFTFARYVYEKVYSQTLEAGHISKRVRNNLAPYLKDMIRFYDNKIYYNLNSWYMLTSIFPGKKNNLNYMENMMGVKTKAKDVKTVKMSLIDLLNLGIRLKSRLNKMKKLSKQFLMRFDEVVMPYLGIEFEHYNEKELLKVFKYIEENIVNDFTTPIINDVGAMMYYGKLTKYVNKLGIEDVDGFISNKVSKQGNVESAKSITLYEKIIEAIVIDKGIRTDFETLDKDELFNKYHNDSPISTPIKEYIKAFGSRVANELKLETITLLEDPLDLYDMLKSSIINKLEVSKNNEVEVLPWVNANIFKKIKLNSLIKKTKYFIKNRELLRLRRTYLYSVIRKIYLRMGELFKERSLIKDARDIFHLKKEEIEMVVEDKLDNLRPLKEIVKSRKEKLDISNKLKTYNRIVFYGDKTLLVEDNIASSSVLKGIGSGVGRVTGKVKLVLDPKNTSLNGEIMLAKRTDPGWITLFPLCKGMIVERGSILSHSAVVARELGIVAVVGCAGATDIIKDGSTVTVDGIKGEVIIEE